MSALQVLLGIWAMVALCAVLFIRGASSRVERPVKSKQTRRSRFSIAE
jgi:hypothetical protein